MNWNKYHCNSKAITQRCENRARSLDPACIDCYWEKRDNPGDKKPPLNSFMALRWRRVAGSNSVVAAMTPPKRY